MSYTLGMKIGHAAKQLFETTFYLAGSHTAERQKSTDPLRAHATADEGRRPCCSLMRMSSPFLDGSI